jgi:hypothetical protein
MSLAFGKRSEMDERLQGVFEIGKVFGYDPQLPPGADYPYHQVTEADVWSDDPRSPNYNRHIVIDPKNPPDNYTHERMRSGDFAYHWLIEIRHNSDPPIPGAGSAIFFHIRRGVSRPTTGCTTMAKADLVKLITVVARAGGILVTRCYLRRNTTRNGALGTCLHQKHSGAALPRRWVIDCLNYLANVSLTVLMRRRPNPDSEANIRRIDTKRRAKRQTHGFQVHFLRGNQVVTRMFSDSIYWWEGRSEARRTKIQAHDPAPSA